MGFLFDQADIGAVGGKQKKGQASVKLLHDLECSACPLNHAKSLHPKMEPSGTEEPDIYILGEFPSEEDSRSGTHFGSGAASGQYLRGQIPAEWLPRLRWNNVLRDRPSDGPEQTMVECCRPSIVRDIEASKPSAIFGFGALPLKWAIDDAQIANWRGRHLPIKVGSHTCWYFPFRHPTGLLKDRHALGSQRTDDEHMFTLDIKRAFDKFVALPSAAVHSKEQALANITSLVGCTRDDAMYIARFLRHAAEQSITGVDYECNGLRPYFKGSAILSVAVYAAGETIAFLLDHPAATWASADLELVREAFLEFLKAEKPRKAVQNLAYEQEWSGYHFGLDYVRAGRWDDTMSQAFVLDQNPGGASTRDDDDAGVMECYGLGFLTQLYFGIDIKTIFNVNRKNIMEVPIERLLPYNGVDAKYHALLCLAQDRALQEAGLTYVYENHLRRIPTCTLTQLKGIPLDLKLAARMGENYDKEISKLEKEIAALPIAKQFQQTLGRSLKPLSPNDMVIVCRDLLHSTAGARKLGGYQVNEAVLSQIPDPIGELVVALRSYSKLRSTYVFEAHSPVVWDDGMLHPQINTVRARTSRLSINDPSGQNFPKRDEKAKEIRRQIIALLNYILLSLDYGQIEARVFAMAAKDQNYIKMLWEDFDIHAEWARRLAMIYPARIGGKQNLSDKKAMKDFRQVVKAAWVFGLFFGARLTTAASGIGIPPEYLKQAERDFWKQFPTIRQWQDDQRKFYEAHGYVELLTGRRRCGPMKPNAIINTPIQGTACEIVMDGMNRISELDVWEGHPLLQIHDDLLFHLPEKDVEEFAQPIIAEMIRPTFDFINVPLMAEMSIGKNWCDMNEIAKFSSAEWYGREAHLGLRS
jgi:uracil-DNA glycosylase family 4